MPSVTTRKPDKAVMNDSDSQAMLMTNSTDQHDFKLREAAEREHQV